MQFDDASLGAGDDTQLVDLPNGGSLSGFTFGKVRLATCPGTGCTNFFANNTQQFTAPHMALAEGLVGGLQITEVDLSASPHALITLDDASGSFDLGNFDVFDIIDLPVRLLAFLSRHDSHFTLLLQEAVHLGAREDMRVHLDCTKAGSASHVKLTIPFNRNKDSAGYSVTTAMLGDEFTALSACDISTTQVFFPLGHELEIPTESMGRECILSSSLCLAHVISPVDNFNACVR